MRHFIDRFFKERRFLMTQYSEGYGMAESGMDSVSWNENGNYICIRKDAGTRIVFNGYVRDASDLKVIMELIK